MRSYSRHRCCACGAARSALQIHSQLLHPFTPCFPQERMHADGDMSMEAAPERAERERAIIATPDLQQQHRVVLENVPDPLAGEQTWPTEEVRTGPCRAGGRAGQQQSHHSMLERYVACCARKTKRTPAFRRTCRPAHCAHVSSHHWLG